MADFNEFDFNPDFSEEPVEQVKEEPAKLEIIKPQQTTVVNNLDNTSVSLNHLVDMTKTHVSDDKRVRDEIDELTGILDDSMHQMSIKEMLEYLKIKLKEREFHQRCIFEAYSFIQRTELAREMLVGGDRKERVTQSMDNQKLTKMMGYLNLNNGGN